jgi:hypothetical protein
VIKSNIILDVPLKTDDIKDPSLVRDDSGTYHIFGSGGNSANEQWGVAHFAAPTPEGPWKQLPTIYLDLPGDGVAAPGVIFDRGKFHMFIQTEYSKAGGEIHYFHSGNGSAWTYGNCVMKSGSGYRHLGIYDPHPAFIDGRCVITYTGFDVIHYGKPQGNIYVAQSESNTWWGPWHTIDKLLDHNDVRDHHNGYDHPDYEWGLEGAQMVELPNGRVLLTAVSFLPHGDWGTRQRVFTAVSDSCYGAFRTLGPTIEPNTPGENGHASLLTQDDDVLLCYQYREREGNWRYALATLDGNHQSLEGQPHHLF